MVVTDAGTGGLCGFVFCWGSVGRRRPQLAAFELAGEAEKTLHTFSCFFCFCFFPGRGNYDVLLWAWFEENQ